jgi:alpha-glucosidase (family GH31 glycosyl hydrolase)
VYNGGKTIAVEAPLGSIPLFVREGAVIPRGDIVKLNNNWDATWSPKLRIEVFPSAKEASEFNYFTGTEAEKIKTTPETDGVAIEFGELGAEGRVEVFCGRAKEVTRNEIKLREGRDYTYDAAAQKLTVAFKGTTKLRIRGAASLFHP